MRLLSAEKPTELQQEKFIQCMAATQPAKGLLGKRYFNQFLNKAMRHICAQCANALPIAGYQRACCISPNEGLPQNEPAGIAPAYKTTRLNAVRILHGRFRSIPPRIWAEKTC